MNVEELLQHYSSLPAPDRHMKLKELIKAGKLQEVMRHAHSGHARTATRILADADDRISEFIQLHIKDTLKLLETDDPKVRMHTAQIIGNNCASDYLDELIDALNREDTMYALPSYLLAIGKAKNIRAKHFLEHYNPRSELDKHLFEEKAALAKALANFAAREKVQVRILPSDVVALSTPNLNVTYTQCQNLGLRPQKFGKYIALTKLKDFYDIYKVRAFCHAYLYLGKCSVADLPSFIAKRENAIVQRTGAKNFRLEVKSVTHKVRLDVIQACVGACKTLQNSPSAYSIELLLEIKDNTADVFLNPLVDERFFYRKKSISASIAPGVAACVCAYASEYFDPDASVLDNFCGSGTMLFERGYYPHHRLTGVDLNQKAIEAANENNKTSFASVQFHHMDALRFTARQYDEIITNLPFGMRVGNHAKNEQLYPALFRVLPSLLKPGGIAVLYTHEKTLTARLIQQSGQFELLKRATFEAGGLYPAVFIIRKSAPCNRA